MDGGKHECPLAHKALYIVNLDYARGQGFPLFPPVAEPRAADRKDQRILL